MCCDVEWMNTSSKELKAVGPELNVLVSVVSDWKPHFSARKPLEQIVEGL